jgi:tetraacyldisaccharide 4'-kinase
MIVSFFERLYFRPKWYDWAIISMLVPLSLIYGSVALARRVLSRPKVYPVPIISVGNLIVGGSGKSPFLISLVKALDLKDKRVAVVSRGYKRDKKSLVVLSKDGELLATPKMAGDEPVLIAKSLKNVDVIVSKNRHEAIQKAISFGANVIFLDDGFSRVDIKKFEILLSPKEIKNPFPFPAGGFRGFLFCSIFADLYLKEERDFFRQVTIKNPTPKMVLATAISNPKRLDKWLDERVVYRHYLSDHSWFREDELKALLGEFGAESILTTQKDFVKMEDFDIPISLMELEIEIDSKVLDSVKKYIKDFDAKED